MSKKSRKLHERIWSAFIPVARNQRHRTTRRRRLGSELLEPRQMLFASVAGDFNGDGFEDHAVGLSRDDVGDVEQAGLVAISYGSVNGLKATTLLHQDAPGVAGAAERFDYFGEALAVGDFNGDGYDDLAVGISLEDTNGLTNNGAVQVFYGSISGLRADGSQLLEGRGSQDRFGSVLAVGNFNGDFNPSTGLSIDDLAVGVPLADLGVQNPINGDVDAGAVIVYHGSTSGIDSRGNRSLTQEGAIDGSPEGGDLFGSALAAGDFNRDGFDDLAIGVPGEDFGWPVETTDDGGAVNLVYGSRTGLSDEGNHAVTRDTPGIVGGIGEGDEFGYQLAAGDFNGDGHDDLAVSSHDSQTGADKGSVDILYGRDGRLAGSNLRLHTDLSGISNTGDQFGVTLVVGNVNGDRFDDLIVGSKDQYLHVLAGRTGNLDSTSFLMLPASIGDKNVNPSWQSITVGDFNGDGLDDMAGFAGPTARQSTSLGDRLGTVQVLQLLVGAGRITYGENYAVAIYGTGGRVPGSAGDTIGRSGSLSTISSASLSTKSSTSALDAAFAELSQATWRLR